MAASINTNNGEPPIKVFLFVIEHTQVVTLYCSERACVRACVCVCMCVCV